MLSAFLAADADNGGCAFGFCYVRAEAFKKIDDEKVWANIACNDEIEYIRLMAINKISNKSALADIAKTNSE